MRILGKDMCWGKNMAVMVLNKELADEILEGRNGFDRPNRREEVWDEVTYIMPEANVEHDDIAGFFYRVFWAVFGIDERNRIQFRVNLSDRTVGWKSNYRVPDTMVFLAGNPAKLCGTHYCGGPDLALEVLSPDDKSREKLDFYALIGTREVIILDRDPWQLELYQLDQGEMKLAGTIEPGDGKKLSSRVGPIEYQLISSQPRPKVKIVHTKTGQEWVV